MTPLVLLLIAAGTLTAPPRVDLGARLRRLVPAGRAVSGSPRALSPATAWSGRPRRVLALSAFLGCGLGTAAHLWVIHRGSIDLLVIAPALAGGIAGLTVARSVLESAAERQAGRALSSLVAAVALLAAELRAGQSPGSALRGASSAAASTPWIQDILEAAAEAAARGGDVADVLRGRGGCADGQPVDGPGGKRRGGSTVRIPGRGRTPAQLESVNTALRVLGAVWQVCEFSGAAPAVVLDSVVADLRSGQRRQQQLTAQLADARSTAELLAGLPVLGLLLGAAMGASPLEVLFGTPAGQIALLSGVVLDAAGVLWSARLVTAATRTSR